MVRLQYADENGHAVDAAQSYSLPSAVRSEVKYSPDARRSLTAAVAMELQRMHMGNPVLDWLEAEILVDMVLEAGGPDQASGPAHSINPVIEGAAARQGAPGAARDPARSA